MPHSAAHDAIELSALLLSWTLTTTASFLWVVRDERRLSAVRLARAWPAVSRDCALVAFGQIAVIAHHIKTRRTWWSPFAGLAAAVLVSVPSVLFELALGAAFPELE